MATRRTGKELSPSELQDPQDLPENSDTTPAVPTEVIVKLLAFTFAMVCAPLGTYFGTVNFVFKGNATYAGASAALAANLVLVAYVVVAMREDQTDRAAAGEKRRDKKME